MAIIAISHQMGAGGSEIGMGVAQQLGYHYVDQELIQDAVRRYGLAEDKLSHLDESKPTLFERFDAGTRHSITILPSTLLDCAEPALYDLVINTEKLRDEAAVEMIGTMVRRPEMATPDAARRIVASRVLPSRVQVALATHPETRRYRITVEAQDGVVTLEATA